MIRSYFETQPFEPTGFHKETTLLQQTTPHFVTNNFRYTIARGQVITFIGYTLYPLFFSVILLLAATRQGTVLLFDLPVTILLLFAGALFINHYRAARGKVLIVSKGSDTFAYGPADNPKTFYKHDIAEIVTFGNHGRGGYGPLAKVEINFVDGSTLELSCIMLNREELVAKFPQCPQSIVHRFFPFISRGASSLSE